MLSFSTVNNNNRMQFLLLSQSLYKISVLGSVLSVSFIQGKTAEWIRLNMQCPPKRNIFEQYFSPFNFIIFWITRFIYITSSSICLTQNDYDNNPKWKVALTILSGPLLNLVMANAALALSLLFPATAVVCNFLSVSFITAAVITLLPIPPSTGYYLLALLLPKEYRNYMIEKDPNTAVWERHLHFLCFWLIASGMVGQSLFHLAVNGLYQYLWAWQPLVTTIASVCAIATIIRQVYHYNKSSSNLSVNKTPGHSASHKPINLRAATGQDKALPNPRSDLNLERGSDNTNHNKVVKKTPSRRASSFL